MNVADFFIIEYGQHEYNSKSNLDNGETLLISSQGADNGCYGFYSLQSKYNPPIITLPRTGSIGEAFVQTIPCCVDDNCLVLIPKEEYTIEYLFYISSIIRNHKWRFMYGRQITPERVGRVEVLSPTQFKTKIDFVKLVNIIKPKEQKVKEIEYNRQKEEFLISDLFEITSGEYHSINDLKEGKIPLISCSDLDNGIAGFYDIPLNKTYRDTITIAYDGKPLTAKYHDYTFSAYDNVGVLTPKREIKKTTLLFITILVNIDRWRYGYGRKCYKQKLDSLPIKLPINNKGEMDEDYIEKIMRNRDLFGYFKD